MVRSIAWPTGWRGIDGDEARGMLGRLKFEMPPNHVLAGVELEAIARRLGTDDVLFRSLDDADRVVVIHLTWASTPERNPEFPGVEFDGTLCKFLSSQHP